MLSTTFIFYFIVLSTTTTLINSNVGGPYMVEGRYLPTRSNTNSLDRLRDLLRNILELDDSTDNRISSSSYDRHQYQPQQQPQTYLEQQQLQLQQPDDYDMNLAKKRNKSMSYLQKNQKYLFKRELLSAPKKTAPSSNYDFKLLKNNVS